MTSFYIAGIKKEIAEIQVEMSKNTENIIVLNQSILILLEERLKSLEKNNTE